MPPIKEDGLQSIRHLPYSFKIRHLIRAYSMTGIILCRRIVSEKRTFRPGTHYTVTNQVKYKDPSSTFLYFSNLYYFTTKYSWKLPSMNAILVYQTVDFWSQWRCLTVLHIFVRPRCHCRVTLPRRCWSHCHCLAILSLSGHIVVIWPDNLCLITLPLSGHIVVVWPHCRCLTFLPTTGHIVVVWSHAVVWSHCRCQWLGCTWSS